MEIKTSNTSGRPHSTLNVLKWLDKHYESTIGACIPRHTLYSSYLEYCIVQRCISINAASFGKIIRQKFPNVTTRRLGTRGKSKYHYYGIGTKTGSPYFSLNFSKFSNVGSESHQTTKKINNKLIMNNIHLPEFPNIFNITFPVDISVTKVNQLIITYRNNCQNILEMLKIMNFSELKSYLVYTCCCMKKDGYGLLNCGIIISIIEVCDHILYNSLIKILVPNINCFNEFRFNHALSDFIEYFVDWIESSFFDLPKDMYTMKLSTAREFTKCLSMRKVLNESCNNISNKMKLPLQCEIRKSMFYDLLKINLSPISEYVVSRITQSLFNSQTILNIIQDFISFINSKFTIKSLFEWMDMIFTYHVKQVENIQDISTLLDQFSNILIEMMLQVSGKLKSSSYREEFENITILSKDYILFKVQNIIIDHKQREKFKSLCNNHVCDSYNINYITKNNDLKMMPLENIDTFQNSNVNSSNSCLSKNISPHDSGNSSSGSTYENQVPYNNHQMVDNNLPQNQYYLNHYNTQLGIPLKREDDNEYQYQVPTSNYQQMLYDYDSVGEQNTAANAYCQPPVQHVYPPVYAQYNESYYPPATLATSVANVYQQENAAPDNLTSDEYSWYYQNNQIA